MSEMSVIFKLIPQLDLNILNKTIQSIETAVAKAGNISLQFTVDQAVKDTKRQLDNLTKSALKVDVLANADSLKQVKSDIDSISGKKVNIDIEASDAVKSFKADIDTVAGKKVNIDVETDVQGVIETTKELNDLGTAADKASEKGGFLSKAFQFNQITQAIDTVSQSLAGLTAPFVQLDSATANIRTLGGEAQANADKFRAMAVAMSKDMPINAPALQVATYEALSAGISATEKDMQAFMQSAGKLAVGGGVEINDTVNLLSSTLNAYGMSAEQTSTISDALFQTVNVGKTSIAELNASMSQVVPTAAAMGYSLNDVGAALALMTANGIPTAQATTKLNQLLIEIQKPGASLAKTFEAAGLSAKSLGDQIRGGDVVGALGNIKSAFEKSGQSATQAFSSTEASAAFNTLTKDMQALQQFTDDVSKSTGATENAYAQMADSIDNRVQAMKSSMQAFGIQVVDSLGSVGVAGVTAANALTELGPTISALAGIKSIIPTGIFDNITKSQQAALALSKSQVAQETVLKGAKVATGVVDKANLAVNTADEAMSKRRLLAETAINAAKKAGLALSNPILLGVMAVVGAITLLYTNSEKFRNALSTIWDSLKPALTQMYEAFKAVGSLLVDVLFANFKYLWDLVKAVTTAIGDWLFPMSSIGKSTSIIKAGLDGVKWVFEQITKTAHKLSDIVAGISSGLTWLVKNGFGTLMKALSQAVTGNFGDAWTTIKSGFSSVGKEFGKAMDQSKIDRENEKRKKNAAKLQADTDAKTIANADKKAKVEAKSAATKAKVAKAELTAYEKQKKVLSDEQAAYTAKLKADKTLLESERLKLGYKDTEQQKNLDLLKDYAMQEFYLNSQISKYKELQALAAKTNDSQKRSEQIKESSKMLDETAQQLADLQNMKLELEAKVKLNADDYQREMDNIQNDIKRMQLEANIELHIAKQSDLELFDLKALQALASQQEKALLEIRKNIQTALINGLDASDLEKQALQTQKLIFENQDKIRKQEQKYTEQLATERIDSIIGVQAREYALKMHELDKTYKAEMRMQNNSFLNRIKAQYNYLTEVKKINKEMLLNTSATYNAINSLSNTFANLSAPKIDKSEISSLKDTKANLAKERATLSESYNTGKIDYEEYQDQLSVLQQQEADNRTAIAKAEAEAQRAVWQGYKDAVSGYFKELADNQYKAVQESIEKISTLREIDAENTKNLAWAQQAEQAAIAQNNVMLELTTSTAIQAIRDQQLELDAARTEAEGDLYAQLAVAAGASFAQMILDGENFGKATLQTMLSTLKAMVPIFAARIMGEELSKRGLGGLVTAAALMAAMYAALGAAEAAVAGAFKTGVVNFKGKGSETSDDNIVRISKGESVLTAKATKHKENQQLFTYLNKTGRSFTDYVEMKREQFLTVTPTTDQRQIDALNTMLEERKNENTSLISEIKDLKHEITDMKDKLADTISKTKLVESIGNYRVKVENNIIKNISQLDLAVR